MKFPWWCIQGLFALVNLSTRYGLNPQHSHSFFSLVLVVLVHQLIPMKCPFKQRILWSAAMRLRWARDVAVAVQRRHSGDQRAWMHGVRLSVCFLRVDVLWFVNWLVDFLFTYFDFLVCLVDFLETLLLYLFGWRGSVNFSLFQFKWVCEIDAGCSSYFLVLV